MPYDNNDFGNDSDGQHLERARILEQGIETHGDDLGFEAGQIDTISAHRMLIQDALTNANIEYADVDEVYAELEDLQDSTHKQYRKCHNYVLGEMVFSEVGALAFLEGAFDTDDELPTRRHDFIKIVQHALKVYNEIGVKHPEVILDADLFDELQNLVDQLEAKEGEIPIERGDAREATAIKNSIRANGEKVYRWVYRRALSHWGNDDSRLLELGMVPKSLIGTPQGGETPTEFEAKVNKVGPGVYDFWCSKPDDVADAKIEIQKLPGGPIEILVEHMVIEEGVFLPFRMNGMTPMDYKAYFTAYDSEGAQVGDVVMVAFTVEPY